MTPEEKAARHDGLTMLQLSGFDEDADRDGLRAMLLRILSRGDAGPLTQQWISKLLSPDSDSFYRLDVTQRTPRNPQDRRDANETFFRLYDIWSEIEKKSSFVRIAEQKTGLSQKTIRKHLKEILEMEKATAEAEEIK